MIIDGKKLADEILVQVSKKVQTYESQISLAIILAGDDPASKIYINSKKKACQKVGIECKVFEFEKNSEVISLENEILEKISELNSDPLTKGIILQLPVYKFLNKNKLLYAIDPKKDVDGLTLVNQGKLLSGDFEDALAPATAKAVIKILDSTGEDLAGKHAVIVGRSELVGKPTALLLLNKNCTVTICHSKTKDLAQHTKRADILVSAVGKKDLITAEMVKKDVIAVDVGINRVDGKLYGDFSEDVQGKASHITPVPGGVGPVTVACLIENLLI